MAGKGDTPRPVNLAKFESNYETIFRKCQSTAEPKAQEANENGATSYATKASALDEDNSSQVVQTALT